MSVEIRVPVLGESVVEATVGRWLKHEGDTVSTGEALVELETDKVNVEVSSDGPGVIEKILRAEGETVHPGESLGVVATSASVAPAEAAPAPAVQPTPEPAPAPAATPVAPAAPEGAEGNGHHDVRATPLAQRVADDLHVNLAQVPPSGPGGRVVRDDVEHFAEHAEAPAEPAKAPAPAPALPAAGPAAPQPPAGARPETRQRLSRRRLTIAHRLVEAQHTAAMLTTFNEVDMSAVMALRTRRREPFKERHGVGLGFMSFFTKAAIGALKAFPQVNAELQGEELVLKSYFDIGIAIGAPEGLVVPVLRNADRMTFAQIERGIEELAKKAKEKTLSLEELRGGTFTITNGGVFGSLLSTPILNPPQVGILGMHKIEQRPVALNGEVVIRPMMYLALSYDHRIVDGREAVQFLVRIKELIEDPETLLLEG
jgi:2-oxoglutarate dehydrogenase E2 component (dihydrolipoamide succinyltransferase)